MTAAGTTNWYEFALAILEEAAHVPPATPWFEAATSGKPLIEHHVRAITTTEYSTPARRPAYSVLSNSRLQKNLEVQIPDWRMQLRSAFSPEPH
jgi:dTDP-4-dehydrorhamnose reductase